MVHEFCVTTGAQRSSESAAEGLWPDDWAVLHVKEERWGETVTHYFWVDDQRP